ncbi:MAG: MotA/TolQ/ExbB proton channel family protein [Methylacidiphilales bacterium]|nr:MotA/TolQ/ExbB proton channel family protein [Candidatus Methylacidiphilales bacterium]
MLEIIQSGGWVMVPIVLCSVIASAIVIERFVFLRKNRIFPRSVIEKVWTWVEDNDITKDKIETLKNSSLLGKVLATGLEYRNQPRFVIQQRLEDVGRQVTSELEQFLYILEIIVSIAPFLGLLGTVIGMIEIFQTVTLSTSASSKELAGGIATALITTVGGLLVAIPALVFHKIFLNKISEIVLAMEREATRLLDVLS